MPGPVSRRLPLMMPALCLLLSVALVQAARVWLVQPETVAAHCALAVLAPECLLRQALILGFLHGFWSFAAMAVLLLSLVWQKWSPALVLLALMLSATTLVLYQPDEGAPLLLLCWLRVLWLFGPQPPIPVSAPVQAD